MSAKIERVTKSVKSRSVRKRGLSDSDGQMDSASEKNAGKEKGKVIKTRLIE